MADNKALAQRFNDEVMSQGKLAAIDEIVAEDFVEHQELPPGIPPGREGLKASVQMFRDAFPDMKVETVKIVADGDEVWMQSVLHGTHKGELAGIPPTGKKVSVTMFDRVVVRDGKAVEHWGVSDDMGMMTALGVVPEMG